MTCRYLLDTTALLRLNTCVPVEELTGLLDRLTTKIADEELGFPKAVVDDLVVRARDEGVTRWAVGVKPSLKNWVPEYNSVLWFSRYAQLRMGYDEGVQGIDGTDPSIVDVAAMAYELADSRASFAVVSHDVGSVPLRPSMEQVCQSTGWRMMPLADCLEQLGLTGQQQLQLATED